MRYFNVVRDFDAVGDNSTDDTGALNAALAAADTAGGGTILFPQGKYRIATLPNHVPGNTIIRLDADTMIRADYSDPGPNEDGLFTFETDEDGFAIIGEGHTSVLTCTGGNEIQTGVRLRGNDNVLFKDFMIDWRDDAITALQQPQASSPSNYFSGIRGNDTGHVRFDNVYFTRCGNRALDLRNARKVWVDACTFTNTGFNDGNGIGGTTPLAGNTGNAISVENSAEFPAEEVFVRGCYLEKWGDTGIGVPEGYNTVIADNILRGAADFGLDGFNNEAGIGVNGMSNLTITGNVVRNVNSHACILIDLLAGQQLWSNHNATIAGNHLLASSDMTGHDGLIAIISDFQGGIVRGVSVTGNVLDLGTNTTLHGIAATGDTLTDLTITGNVIRADSVSSGQFGIRFTAGGPDRYVVSGNVITNLDRGLEIQAGTDATSGINGLVVNNVITNATIPINNQRKGGPRVTQNYGLDDIVSTTGNADGTTTTKDSRKTIYRGSYWDGSAAQAVDAEMWFDVTGSNAGQIIFRIAGTNRWGMNSSGHLYPLTNNSYDVGSTSLKVRDVHVGRNLDVGGAITQNGQALISSYVIAAPSSAATWTAMPSALTELGGGLGAGATRVQADLSNKAQARLVAMVTTAGATSAELRGRFSTNGGSTWAYLDNSSGPNVAINSTGLKSSTSWVNLTAAAKTDVMIQVWGINGDGVTSPAFGNIQIQVR